MPASGAGGGTKKKKREEEKEVESEFDKDGASCLACISYHYGYHHTPRHYELRPLLALMNCLSIRLFFFLH